MKRLASLHTLDVSRREALLVSIERLTELPLLVLAFVMIPLLVGPFLWELSPGEEAIFIALLSGLAATGATISLGVYFNKGRWL